MRLADAATTALVAQTQETATANSIVSDYAAAGIPASRAGDMDYANAGGLVRAPGGPAGPMAHGHVAVVSDAVLYLAGAIALVGLFAIFGGRK